MAGAKFSPVLAAAVGALLVALTQARGHCHSGRYYSGLELGTRSDNTTSCFFANTGIGRVQPAAVQVQGGGWPGPRRLVLTSPVSAAGGQWRHVTLSRAPHHSCGCHESRCHDAPLLGLSLAWCRVLGVFTVLTRELGMGK